MFLVLDFVYIVLYIKIFFNYKVNEKFALLFSLISQNFRKKNVNLYYKLASFFFFLCSMLIFHISFINVFQHFVIDHFHFAIPMTIKNLIENGKT